MALRNRRKKKPLPDWMGVSHNAKNHDSVVLDKRDFVQETFKSSSTVLLLPSQSSATSVTVSDYGKSNKFTSVELTKNESVPHAAEEIIRLSLPLLKFNGSLIYSFDKSDCSILCEDIMSCLSQGKVLHVGFDMEWPVTFSAGSTSKTALIQICTGEDRCYLFHITAMGTLPKALSTLLSNSLIIKYGMNIEADFWKLERDFDFDISVRKIICDSVKDLGKMANAKLKSVERWTLDGLTRNVFRMRLNKEGNVRCGRWDQYPLSDEQLQYAAADAYACWMLADHLREKPTSSDSVMKPLG